MIIGEETLAGMGTEIQYAINLPGTSASISSSSFSVQHWVDDQEEHYSQTTRLNKTLEITGFEDKFCSTMDRIPDKQSIDFIKKTMQMHEDVFKQQVRELHRLYSVQKMLMDELKKEIKQNRKYWNSMTSSDINLSQSINILNSTAQITNCAYSFNNQSLRDDPTSKERSGSCSGGETMRMARGFDLERPAAADQEDISTGVSAMDDLQARPSSSCMPLLAKSSHKMSFDGSDDEGGGVELTLGIGGGSGSKKMSKDYQAPLHCQELDSPAASFKSERGEDCSAPNTPMSSSSATCDQERKRPHWLFQSLSINRT